MAIAVSPWVGLDKVEWNCRHQGGVFDEDSKSNGFYSMQCLLCDEGTYSIGSKSEVCRICPYGAVCERSTAEVNGLRAVGGFWGFRKQANNDEVEFVPCPSGYCCELGDTCRYDYCSGGRTGRLCGRCEEGYGLAFFTTSCVATSECNDSKWAIPVAIMLAFVVVGGLAATSGKETSGLSAVLLFFYQVSPLVKSTPWRHVSPLVIGGVQSVFSLAPPDTSSSGGSVNKVCIVHNMTASQKSAAQMLFQAVVLCAIGVTFIGHGVVKRSLLFWDVNGRLATIIKITSLRAIYMPVVVDFLGIAYITMVLVPLQMVQCVLIDGRLVWAMDGSQECYEAWQEGAFVAITVLSPVPLLVIVMMHPCNF